MSAPANRLATEKSPYLRQHAANPVDWYPWGDEAFEKARSESKPIFLSIGYSTCHWCHVMAHESFENAATAEILNENFVCIKVDREERPDVDRVYMAFVQATTGGGGWPLSAWLTPELAPFVGGTYFPPDDRYGRRGFPAVLHTIAEAWKKDRPRIEEHSSKIIAALRHGTKTSAPAGESATRTPADFERAVDSLWIHFDREWGGFGSAPKFPRPAVLRFLARASVQRELPEEVRGRARLMWLTTLRRMAMGGMHDHLGGGFHRYAVDAHWHVPHFEKMLYDQGQLAASYLEAFQLTGEAEFADTVRDILEYVLRDLTSPEGAFYCAEDADSIIAHGSPEHAEGAFYVWSAKGLERVLSSEEYSAFASHYGIQPQGNVRPESDPHGEFQGQNVPMERCPISQTASEMNVPGSRVVELLAAARRKLFEHRAKRPRPHLDDKVLTAWNGLMLGAFARAGVVLGEARYTTAALRAAEFIRSQLFEVESGELRRIYREGTSPIAGFADDYAFLIAGLLDLYEATGDDRELAWAETLQATQDRLFLDATDGGWFSNTGADRSVLLRLKEEHDGAEPAATSVSVLNLLRLAALTGRPEFRAAADRAAAAFFEDPERLVHSMPLMLAAQDALGQPPVQVVVAGPPEDPRTHALLRAAHRTLAPDRIVLLAPGGEAQLALARRHSYLAEIGPVRGEPAAFVCRNFLCLPAVTDPEALSLE